MKYLSILLCLVATLLMAIPATAFCLVPQPRLVCAEYFASQLVVEATLVQTTELGDKDEPLRDADKSGFVSAYMYTLHVNQTLRGSAIENIRVYESNDSGRAVFDWKPGVKYLLFLFYVADQKAWALDGCGNSGPSAKAGMALSAIAAIKTAKGGGTIQGLVSKQLISTRVAGVQVEAEGSEGRFAATTNAKGEFKINVPAGRYAVHAGKAGTNFELADISYGDPSKVVIEPGACAQLQFAEPDRPPTVP